MNSHSVNMLRAGRLHHLLPALLIVFVIALSLSPVAVYAAPVHQDERQSAAQQSIAEKQLAEGVRLFEAERWNEALSTLNSAHTLFTATADTEQSALALLYIGRVKIELGDLAGAQAAITESAAQLKESENLAQVTAAAVALGDLYFAQAAYDDARTMYQDAISSV
ncbi:MAG: hypothetical protein KDE19_11940, partial [Caldilineaceae bacterium]|nr:hypothetical protein [Caldilineaceae bacterium]